MLALQGIGGRDEIWSDARLHDEITVFLKKAAVERQSDLPNSLNVKALEAGSKTPLVDSATLCAGRAGSIDVHTSLARSLLH